MLTHITIKGLAIVDSLEIDFEKGFNVITGETGAGKSILIKAMNLLLGAKASHDIVRAGADAATVIGCFSFPAKHQLVSLLERYELPIEASEDYAEHFDMIIRRVITSKGRSSAWINDVPVTNTTLKEVAEMMIDVMSQFENSKLCDPSNHPHLVDQFIKDESILEKWSEAYAEISALRNDLNEWLETVARVQKNYDYLAYRAKELNEFQPSEEDYQTVFDFCERSKKLEGTKTALSNAQDILDGGYQGSSLARALKDVSRALVHLKDPQAEELRNEIDELSSKFDDVSFKFGKIFSDLDFDENELEQKQARLSEYYDLFRKMSVKDIHGLVSEFENLARDLQFAEESQATLDKKIKALCSASTKIEGLSNDLSNARKAAAKKMVAAIDSELKDLAMAQAAVKVDFLEAQGQPFDLQVPVSAKVQNDLKEIERVSSKLSSHGFERAQIMLKSNAGESFLPLHKVASGGEASRILLALKKALVAGGDTCILVFDEIDTGISGRVADMVGKKLRQLAKSYQLICISHIPQVVAHADVNFRVEKITRGGRTESTIKKLQEKESIEELARLLSGTNVTKQSYDNAKTLRTQARS